MKIRPGHPGKAGPVEAWLEQLDAALDGQGDGRTAESWRSLRDDVRVLAPPLAPELQRRLEQRIAERARQRRLPLLASRPTRRSTRAREASHAPGRRPRGAHLPGRMRSRLSGAIRPGALIGPIAGLAVTVTLIVALVVVAPWGSAGPPAGGSVPLAGGARDFRGAQHGPVVRSGPAKAPAPVEGGAARARATTEAAEEGAEAPSNSTLAPGPSTPERKQQLAASMTLGPEKDAVQSTSERVARIAVRDGGFVVHSNVQVQRTGSDEADLALELPSAKLGAALAALARLAPVDAENQSLQDITSSYEAASHRLADARAEHRALLRALSRANTAAAIEAVHRRLSENAGTIARASTELRGVTRRASTAEVEVTVVGQSHGAPAHTGSGGLTIDRGLRDAGHVLAGALAVLLLAGAVLVPLALVLIALGAGWRAWRRYQREQALRTPRPSP